MKNIRETTSLPHADRRVLTLLGLTLLTLVSAVFLSGCGQDAEAVATPTEVATRVHVAEVTAHAAALPIHTSGRLAAKAEASLSFKISGIIQQISVDEGQTVRRGQVLARLDLAEINAQVAQAKSAFDKAQRDFARMERLYADSVVTLAQFQDAQTGLETAEASVEMATFNQRYAVITAPADGSVLRRMAEPNELVTPGQAVLRMSTHADGWVVRVGLADRDVVRLQRNDRAEVTFDAFPGETFAGRITEIADAANPQSSTFEVEIQVEDPQRRLKSGFVGAVALQPSTGATMLRVPIEALVRGNGDEGLVYVLDPATGRAQQTTIHIARLLDDGLLLHDGLDAGDRVITDGAAYLRDGGLVEVVE